MVSRWEQIATRIRLLLAASKTASTLSPLWYRIIIRMVSSASTSLSRSCSRASHQSVDLFGYGSKVLVEKPGD
jgi:hypothetical protein